MSRIHPLDVRVRLRRIQLSRFVAAHPDTPFIALTRDGSKVMVHREDWTHERKWRLTYFDRLGPAGHCYASDYRDAVRLAAGEFAADLTKAEF